MNEKDLLKLWEEDGDLEHMKAFFQRFNADTPQKDRIKQLTQEKLAQTDTLSESGIEANLETALEADTRPKHSFFGPWLQRLSALRRAWGFKLAVPVVLLILFVIVGQQGLGIHLPGLRMGSSTKNVAYDQLAVAPKGAVSTEMAPAGSAPQGYADQSSRSAASGPFGKPDQPILPIPEVPPADAGLPRNLTQNLSAVLQVEDVWKSIDTITEQVKVAGGYVIESQQNSAGNSASGWVTAKIPAARLDSFKASFSSWGKVLDQHLTSNDITNQYYDAQTRLAAWETEQQRYLEILKQAKTVNDIIMVENSLANIRQQIEQLKGQLKLWTNQVDYSTVQLQLQTKPSPDVQIDNPWQPVSWLKTWNATKNAVLKTLSSTWNAVNYLFIGIGYAFPYLILAALIWLGYRFWKK